MSATELTTTSAPEKPAPEKNRFQHAAWVVSGIGFVLAAFCLWYRHQLHSPLRVELVEDLDYWFVLTAWLGVVAFYLGWGRRWPLAKVLSARGLIVPGAAISAALTWKLGMHQFGGFDEGLVVHAATYYAHGMRPFYDFPCSMPPFFMAGIRAATLALGLHWSSLLLLGVVFEFVTSLAIFKLLADAGMPRHYAVGLALCVEAGTMMQCPFWWYNNTSVVTAVWLLVSVLACLHAPGRRFAWLNLSLALAVVLTSKPNALPIVCAVVILFATRERRLWRRASAAVLGSAVLAWGIYRFAQMPLTLTLHAYRQVGRLRGNPFGLDPFVRMDFGDRYFQSGFFLAVLLCFLFVVVNAVRAPGAAWRPVAACGVAAGTALVMGLTNAEMKNTDLSLMLVAMVVLCFRPWSSHAISPLRSGMAFALLAVFFVAASYFSATHLRILQIGEGMFYEPLPTTTIRSGFFKGLEAGPRLQAVLAQTADALERYPAQKVFFGPRMEFEYAVYGKVPVAGMPLLWDAGNLFPGSELAHYLAVFKQEDPDLLIFLKNDYTRMGEVGMYVRTSRNYRRIDSYNDLTVYVRNP